jgi:hypothetical protein
MSEDATKEAGYVLGAIAALLASETDMNPVITPVLDLTNIESGAAIMRQMLGIETPQTIDTRFASRYTANSMPRSSNVAENQNGSDYSGIYNRMAQIDTTLTELGAKIERMKLVLDSGALVGGIIDQVDVELGARASFEGRRG